MGFPLADFIRTASEKNNASAETSGRFDGSFLCAETDDFHQRSRKFQPFTDYWDGATQKKLPILR